MTEFGHVLSGLEPWLHQYGVAAVFLILTFEFSDCRSPASYCSSLQQFWPVAVIFPYPVCFLPRGPERSSAITSDTSSAGCLAEASCGVTGEKSD